MLQEMNVHEMSNTNGGIGKALDFLGRAQTAVQVVKTVYKAVTRDPGDMGIQAVPSQWTNPTSSNYKNPEYNGRVRSHEETYGNKYYNR